MKFFIRAFIPIAFVVSPIAGAKGLAARHATVAVDGAAVYSQPNFDAPVVEYLSYGTKVVASKKSFQGFGGLGLFYKVRTPSGHLGYLTDTNLVAGLRKLQKQREKSSGTSTTAQPAPPPDHGEPFFFRRYMGGTLGPIGYSEKFSGHKLTAHPLFVGFRLTGPGVLFDGPPLDFDFLISPSAPKYLHTFGQGNSTGFLLLGDLNFFLPFKQGRRFLIDYGLGLMWTYSRYKVKVDNQFYDSQELRVGGDLAIGASYRISRYAIRLDAKYFFERTSYWGEFLTLQTEY